MAIALCPHGGSQLDEWARARTTPPESLTNQQYSQREISISSPQPIMESTTPPRSSTPSLVAESIADEDTNTLILTSVPVEFFIPDVLAALRDHFASYGQLHSWAPLKGFRRIVMTYWTVEDAAQARVECDGMVLADEEGKVCVTAIYHCALPLTSL